MKAFYLPIVPLDDLKTLRVLGVNGYGEGSASFKSHAIGKGLTGRLYWASLEIKGVLRSVSQSVFDEWKRRLNSEHNHRLSVFRCYKDITKWQLMARDQVVHKSRQLVSAELRKERHSGGDRVVVVEYAPTTTEGEFVVMSPYRNVMLFCYIDFELERIWEPPVSYH